MFFIASKILGYLLLPVIWLVILLAIALFYKNKKTQRGALIAALALVLVFSNSFIVGKISSVWDTKPTVVNHPYDVGIVLGGSTITFDKKYQREIFHDNIDRLLQAVELYQKGYIKKILITGGAANLIYKDVKEAKLMDAFLRSINIPARDILIDTLAQNTHQNAVYSKEILEHYPQYKKLLLFTSSMHMRRASACFRKVGLKVSPYPTNIIGDEGKSNIEYLFVPDISNFLTWNAMIHEMMGYMAYKIMGYV